MIRICPFCSKLNQDKIIAEFGEDNVEVSCVGVCRKIEGKVFGYFDYDYIEVDTEEQFIEAAKKHINS